MLLHGHRLEARAVCVGLVTTITIHFHQPLWAAHARTRQMNVMRELERRGLGDRRPAGLSDSAQAISP